MKSVVKTIQLEVKENLPVFDKDFLLFDPVGVAEDGKYIGFVFTVDVPKSNHQLLVDLQKALSDETHKCEVAFSKHFATYKPAKSKKKKTESTKAEQGARGALVSHGKAKHSKDPLAVLKRKLKNNLKEWPGRMANSIIGEAAKTVSARRSQATYQLKLIRQRLKIAVKKNKLQRIAQLKADIKYWEEVRSGKHFLVVSQKYHQKLQELGVKVKACTCPKLLVKLQHRMEQARMEFDAAKLLPLTQVGYNKEEIHNQWTGNKTVCIVNLNGKLHLMIKLPSAITGSKGRNKELLLPINELTGRNKTLYEEALKLKKAMTYQINFRGDKLVCYGTRKLDKHAKLAYNKRRRIGVDQNGGFTTVSLIEGKKVIWVIKRRLPQKKCSEARLEQLYAVCKELIGLSIKHSAPIVLEDLKLVGKKTGSRRANRKISQIPYAKFKEILDRLSYTTGVSVFTVNPFCTSVIARFSYPGMSVHQSAAIMIARRHLGEALIKARIIWENDIPYIKVNHGWHKKISVSTEKDASASPVVKLSKTLGKALQKTL